MPVADVLAPRAVGLASRPARPNDAVAEAEAMADTHLARTEDVERMGRLVRWLENLVRVPGTRFRFGLDAILGAVLPGAGDLVTGALALTLIATAARRGVPRVVLARMLVNVGVDTVVGLVPVAGDAFDLLWRSNVKNLELLERHQGELEPRARVGDWAIVGAAATMVLASIAAPIFLIAWLVSLF